MLLCDWGELLNLKVVCGSDFELRLGGNNSWTSLESRRAGRLSRGLRFSVFQAGLQDALGKPLSHSDICFVPRMLKSVVPEPPAEPSMLSSVKWGYQLLQVILGD